MKHDLTVRGGTVVTAAASFPADIGVADGRIISIADHLDAGDRDVDARGRLVVPGAIDVHTHFDHFVPYVGTTNADDYDSGTRAAAAGGTTTIVNFAFQEEGESLRAAVEHELDCANGRAWIDYGIHLTVTDLAVPGVLDEVTALADEGFASLKIFTSVGTYALPDADVVRVLAHARKIGLLVSVHAEDHALIEFLTQEQLAAGAVGVDRLPIARPPAAEAIATARVAAYARALDTPVYFVHLSCRDALEAVRRERSAGARIYVETRPVYLFLDASRYELGDREGNKYVCLPPLRGREHQSALWDGLRNGEIQTYATDHAPWTAAQKTEPTLPFPRIPAGVSNVQTSIGMLFAEGVTQGRISANRFVAVTATNPARLFGLWPRKGTLAVGSDADIVLIDPELPVRIDASAMLSKADYDPYEGYEGVGWPVMTISRGEIVADHGRIVADGPRGELLRRSRYLPA
jgi:dihydropyrimidinase